MVCLLWGLLFTLVTPPFQAPDEPEHLFKMWNYTQGSVNYKLQDNWVGNNVPVSFAKIYYFYNQYRWTYKKIPLKETKYISTFKLDKNEQMFLRYNAPAYTPLSYFPAFLVLWVLKLLNIAPLLMTYLMRICFLLIYTALGYLAIKTTPCKKWMFFIMQTLPLLLVQAASINTDALFFGIIFVFYAYTLKLRFEESPNSSSEKITNKQICIWGALSVFITLLKFAYSPLFLLYFLIPKEKTECEKNYYRNFLILVVLNLLAIGLFMICVTGDNGYREFSYNKNISTSLVLADILRHPSDLLYAFFVTTKMYLKMNFYYTNMISSIGTTLAAIPMFATNSYWFLLLLSAFYKEDKETDMVLSLKEKFLMSGMILLCYALVLTSVYLVYQHYPFISAMQGRYLTPLLPAALLLFGFKKLKFNYKFVPAAIFFVSQFLLVVTLTCYIIMFY